MSEEKEKIDSIETLETADNSGVFVKKKINWKPAVSIICFLLIFVLLFSHFQDVFELKGSGYGKYSNYIKEEEQTINTMYFGNSRMNRALDPLILDDICGTYSYNMAIQGLRAKHVYYRILNAFETQSPKFIILETSILLPGSESMEESYLHRTLVSLPTSAFKLKAAYELGTTTTQKFELAFPFFRFHARYKELESVDYYYIMNLRDDVKYEGKVSEISIQTHRGYTVYTKDTELKDDGKNAFGKNYSKITDIAELDEESKLYWEKIIAFLREHDCQILLLSVPSIESNASPKYTVPIMNYLQQTYGNDSDIKLLDLGTRMEEVGLDYSLYQNKGHLNVTGAAIVSEYVGNYINDNYDLSSIIKLTTSDGLQ